MKATDSIDEVLTSPTVSTATSGVVRCEVVARRGGELKKKHIATFTLKSFGEKYTDHGQKLKELINGGGFTKRMAMAWKNSLNE